MNISLPSSVKYILNALEEKGYRADIVGGSVRDAFLGREIGDYDITTDALPEEVERVFSGHRIIETGLKHGTVSLLLDGVTYEITTYRRDGEYIDNRHPSGVSFVKDISEDLCRRDFTVNAMSYSDTNGLTDLFGGKADLERKIIRAVGNPQDRFEEDALRILRALRFASTLSFEIDKDTARAAREKKELLKNVSAERIFVELTKLISGVGAYEVLREYEDIILTVLPLVDKINLPEKEKFLGVDGKVRLIILYALQADRRSERFSRAMSALKTDRKRRVDGEKALCALADIVELDLAGAAHLLNKYGEEPSEIAVKAAIALERISEGSLAALESVRNGALPYKICQLKIGGEDIKALGFKDGEIGRALDFALLSVMEGECENDREALILNVTKGFAL